MKFTILSVAFPLAPVRTDTAGGAEQVLSMIDSALVHSGHKSIVIACSGSAPEGILVATPGVPGQIDSSVEELVHEQHRIAISQAISKWDIDLIHMHGIDFENYLPPAGIPVLVTLHLPPEWYTERAFLTDRPETYFNCVSKSQLENCPQLKGMMPYIENGVVIENYSTGIVKKENFALSLGRVCVEKGYHCALDAARKADIALIIAGELYPYEYHQEFFRNEILPRLDNDKYKFIGPVGPEKKRDLLNKARCLLVPSLVPETSSLVAMEAMASGTPVIAYPQGALKEIVEHGKTGFLVNSISEMAESIKRIDDIDPYICRQTARERFSAETMIGKYFHIYQSIIENKKGLPGKFFKQVANG